MQQAHKRHKHFLSIILLTLYYINFGFSQDMLEPEWTLLQSSSLPNGNAEAWAISGDQNGKLYWGVNQDLPSLFKYMDVLVIKLDTEKSIIWTDTAFIGQFSQQSYNLKVTDSIVYVGGRACRLFGPPKCDVLFFNTNTKTGETGWITTWDGGFGYEEINGIALEPEGIYTTGWSAGEGTEIEVLLMKLDYSGGIIWQKTWGSPGAKDDHQDGQIVVDDAAIYISGLYSGSPVQGLDGKALLAKFSKVDGTLIDSLTYGRNDTWPNAENALGMTSDGTYLYVTGHTTPSPDNWDLFVAKFDKNLNQLWYTTWGGPDVESARAIVLSDDGSLYIGGTTKSYGVGDQDVVLLKYSTDGDLKWFKTWGGEFADHTLDIYINDSYLYLTGKSNSFHPSQNWDALLLKILIDSTSSITYPAITDYNTLQISPNPVDQQTSLTYTLPENDIISISLVDVLGKTVETIVNKELQVKGKHTQIINLPADCTPGLYLLVLSTPTSRMYTRLVKH